MPSKLWWLNEYICTHTNIVVGTQQAFKNWQLFYLETTVNFQFKTSKYQVKILSIIFLAEWKTDDIEMFTSMGNKH